MTLEARKAAFIELGDFLTQFIQQKKYKSTSDKSTAIESKLAAIIEKSVHHNGWFTEDNILFALENWGKTLTEKNLNTWLSSYNIEKTKPKTIAIIMAGNIPLVGFHDFLCVLISGNKALVRQSSKDNLLLPLLSEFLIAENKGFASQIEFTKEKLTDFDAVIATGSNNTARYFEYYFSKKPNIIRKNRKSVAILTGKESQEDLKNLAEDIFRYFGLGCRSVSKLFVPKDYDFKTFFEAIFDWNPIINQNKYANNYDYNKAVYLMSGFNLLDNGFLMLKEEESYSSPISAVFYETYNSEEELHHKLENNKDAIQCIASQNLSAKHIPLGKTQHPKLHEYADHIDTLAFLLKL